MCGMPASELLPLARWKALCLLSLAPLAALLTAAVVLRHVTTDTLDAQEAVDTVAATVGLLFAYLLLGRYLESDRISDLLLCLWLLLLGLSSAAFAVIPHALGEPGWPRAAAVSAVLTSAVFVGATWLAPVSWPARSGAAPVFLCASVALVLAVSTAVGGTAGEAASSYARSGVHVLGSQRILQLLAALLLAAGAAGAVRHAASDVLMSWLGAAAVLAVAARVDAGISARTGDAWSTASTGLRVGFYAVLMVAAAVEIRSYWRRVAEVAVLEERRRVARDLHDGLAQELAFAATQARALADRSEHPTRARLIAAATERALDESRRAIAALTRPLDEPLEISVAQCAEEVCDRFEKQLLLDVESGLTAPADTREALLRVLREAVANAARHSGADEVRVRLRQIGGLELRVEDDGRGFDVNDLGHLSGRFGMISMRERVEALGGTFTVVSRLRGGTAIEVTLP
jgi:signal transduction histidine kinase